MFLSIASVERCHVEVSATDRSLVQRSPTECGVSTGGLHEATVQAAGQGVQSPTSERAENKLAMPITRNNEKAGHSASRAVIHHSTSQR